MYSAESKVEALADGFVSNPALMLAPDATSQAVVQTVAYADVFDYPMRPSEIFRYLIGTSMTRNTFEVQLANILEDSFVLGEQQGYLFLHGRDDLVAVRKQRQAKSDALWPAAVHYGRMIARLPFVRMVAVTGSLAVNNMGNYEDVDYFIVTADDALWITRAMVIMIVRLAAQQGIRLCPNYFLTERAMLITDQTLYTAHEIGHMVPLSGPDVYTDFRTVNDWTDRFLPNAQGAPWSDHTFAACEHRPDPTAEMLLRTPPGRWFNEWEMRRKIRKLGSGSASSGETVFTADCCKGHFNSHQNSTLRAYSDRLATQSSPIEP